MRFAGPIGESGGFIRFQGILMISGAFVVIDMFVSTPGTSGGGGKVATAFPCQYRPPRCSDNVGPQSVHATTTKMKTTTAAHPYQNDKDENDETHMENAITTRQGWRWQNMMKTTTMGHAWPSHEDDDDNDSTSTPAPWCGLDATSCDDHYLHPLLNAHLHMHNAQ